MIERFLVDLFGPNISSIFFMILIVTSILGIIKHFMLEKK